MARHAKARAQADSTSKVGLEVGFAPWQFMNCRRCHALRSIEYFEIETGMPGNMKMEAGCGLHLNLRF